VNLLIIGAGSIGTRRARICKANGHRVAVCDTDTEKAVALGAAMGWRITGTQSLYFDLRTALETERFDAAFICTPPEHHLDAIELCAERQTHVFIEKPLCDTLDVERITRAWNLMREAGCIAIMGQSYRHLQSLRTFGDMIDLKNLISGYIISGQHLADWRKGDPKQSPYAKDGIVLTSLSHSLDIANYLFGEIDTLTALVGNSGTYAGDDAATVLIRTARGAQIVIQNDYWKRPRETRIGAAWATDDLPNHFEWELPLSEVDSMYVRETLHFIDAVKRGVQLQPDFLQGVKVMEWIDAVKRSRGTWERTEGLWQTLAKRQ
jgi:predicted dehydrogenase